MIRWPALGALFVLATATASAQEWGGNGMGIFTDHPGDLRVEGDERDDFGNLEFDESSLFGSADRSDDLGQIFRLGGSDRITIGGTGPPNTDLTATTAILGLESADPAHVMPQTRAIQPSQPVPEPGLMIAGGLGVLALLRRRKTQSA